MRSSTYYNTISGGLSSVQVPSRGYFLLVSSRRGAASPAAAQIRSLTCGKSRSVEIEGRPTPSNIRRILLGLGCPHTVVALGGGSVIDAAKVVAFASAQMDGPKWLERWLENGVLGAPVRQVPNIIAIPTLLGSGAEVTPFATIWLDDRKISLEHPQLKPSAVICLASYMDGLAYAPALFAALDAFSHALEAIWNRNATSNSDAAAERSLTMLAHLLPRFRIDAPLPPMEDLFDISVYSGCAIAITRTAVAHSISYPFTCELDVPHGLACSFALPEVARFNLSVEGSRLQPAANAFRCSTKELPQMIARLYDDSGLSVLARRYLPRNAVDLIKGSMADGGRSSNNLRSVTECEARSLARSAISRIWA